MPELPEVETVRRGLAPRLVGHVLARVEQRRPDLRFPLPRDFAKRLTGRRITGIFRRAKYLLLNLDDGNLLMVHLGMSGRMVLEAPKGGAGTLGEFYHAHDLDSSHDHVVLTTEEGWSVHFNDPRRFGMMDLVPASSLGAHKLIHGLGPEPLDAGFDAAELERRLKGKKTPVKAALLDQRVVVGIGNIYACEALNRAGLSPKRLAGTIKGERAARLIAAIKAVLEEAIAAGGSSLRDYRQATGELGYFQHRFRVYDRAGKPCPRRGCGGTVKRLVQGGRSTLYCPSCQR